MNFSDSFAAIRVDRRNPVVARLMIEGMLELSLKSMWPVSLLAVSYKLGDSAEEFSLKIGDSAK